MLAVKKIPKKNGKFRRICIPDTETMRMLRMEVPLVQALAITKDKHNVVHGFMPGRSCVTNCIPHIPYNYTISFDLEDFFDCVIAFPSGAKSSYIKQHAGSCYRARNLGVWAKGTNMTPGAPQGLPSSPAIANIAFSHHDITLYHIAKKYNGVYTRYADDLTFSVKTETQMRQLIKLVKKADFGEFKLNTAKTKVQCGKKGNRRIITGIAVDKNGLHPTRKLKRKIRAARHQNNMKSLRGLEEWAKCKEPDVIRWMGKSNCREVVDARFMNNPMNYQNC